MAEEITVMTVKSKQSAMSLSPQKRTNKDIKSIFDGLGGNQDLDWFSFENRIRTLVVQLLDPMQKKIKEEENKNDMQRNEIDFMKKRVDELDFITQKTSRRASLFEEMSRKINEQEVERKILESKVYQEITKILNAQEVLKEKHRATHHQIDSFNKVLDHITEEFRHIKQTFHESREQFLQNYNKLHEDFSQRVSSMYSQLAKVDEVRNLYEMQILTNREDLKRFDLKVERCNREVEKIEFQLGQRANQFEEYVQEQISKMANDVSQIKNVQISQEKEMRLTDYFLDKILPLKTLTQTCELLHDVIIYEKEFNKLITYQNHKIPLLEQEITSKQAVGYVLDKQSYVIPTIPQMKDEKKRYTIQRSIRNSHQSLSRSPSQQSFLGVNQLIKNGSLSKANLIPQTPNTRARPLDHTPNGGGDINQQTLKSNFTQASKHQKLQQYGPQNFNLNSQNIQLSKSQKDFLAQLLQLQAFNDPHLSDSNNQNSSKYNKHNSQVVEFRQPKLVSQLQYQNKQSFPAIVINKLSSHEINNNHIIETDQDLDYEGGMEQENRVDMNKSNRDQSQNMRSSNLKQRRSISKEAKQSKEGRRESNNQINNINQIRRRDSNVVLIKSKSEKDDLQQVSSFGAENSNNTSPRKQIKNRTSILKSVRNELMNETVNKSPTLEKYMSSPILNKQVNTNNQALTKIQMFQIDEETQRTNFRRNMSDESVPDQEQSQMPAQFIISPQIILQNQIQLEELKEKASEEYESPQLSDRKRRKTRDKILSQKISQSKSQSSELSSVKSDSQENKNDSNHQNDIEEDSNSRDDMILTESELLDKFKEFRKQFFEEEKAQVRELCEEVSKAQVQSQFDNLLAKTGAIPENLTERLVKAENLLSKLDSETLGMLDRISEDMRKKNREKREYQLDFKEASTMHKLLESRFQILSGLVNQIQVKMQQHEEAMMIQEALELQEEQDKTQVGLYGYFESEQNSKKDPDQNAGQQQVISLNNNCIACSGNSSFVMKAFKIACLAYKPNKVTYNNKQYDRQELIRLKTMSLQISDQNAIESQNQNLNGKSDNSFANNQDKIQDLLTNLGSTQRYSSQKSKIRPSSSSTVKHVFNKSHSGYTNQFGRNSSLNQTEREVKFLNQPSINSVKFGGAEITQQSQISITNENNKIYQQINHEDQLNLAVIGKSTNKNYNLNDSQIYSQQQQLQSQALIAKQQKVQNIAEKTKNLLNANKDNLISNKDHLNLLSSTQTYQNSLQNSAAHSKTRPTQDHHTKQRKNSLLQSIQNNQSTQIVDGSNNKLILNDKSRFQNLSLYQSRNMTGISQGGFDESNNNMQSMNENKQAYTQSFRQQSIQDMRRLKQKQQIINSRRKTHNTSAFGNLQDKQSNNIAHFDNQNSSILNPYQLNQIMTKTQNYQTTNSFISTQDRQKNIMKVSIPGNEATNQLTQILHSQISIQDMTQTPNSVSSQSIGYLKVRRQTPHKRSKSILMTTQNELASSYLNAKSKKAEDIIKFNQ